MLKIKCLVKKLLLLHCLASTIIASEKYKIITSHIEDRRGNASWSVIVYEYDFRKPIGTRTFLQPVQNYTWDQNNSKILYIALQDGSQHCMVLEN